MTKPKKEKYQWSIYVNSLNIHDLRKLILALHGNVSLNIDVVRNKAIIKFAKNRLENLKKDISNFKNYND